MLIFRRFNCICTASGTVTLCERPYVTLVKIEFSLNQFNVRPLIESDGTRCCAYSYTIEPPEDEDNKVRNV